MAAEAATWRSRVFLPFPVIAAGLAIVVLDFRAGGLDLAFDPVGWLLVAISAQRLALESAVLASSVAAVLSVSDAFLPFHYRYVDPETGEPVPAALAEELGHTPAVIFDPATGLRLAALAAAAVAAGVALWLLLDGLAGKARAAGAVDAARQFHVLRWLVPGLWVLPYLTVLGVELVTDGEFDPVWNGGLERVVIVGLLPFAWLAVLLLNENRKAWTYPKAWVRPSPWARIREARARTDQPPSAPP